jgi:uncharacterized damage-inducible protein DinB
MAAETRRSPKQHFLEHYEKEHATTKRVLDAYPEGQLDVKFHSKLKTARELAWVFVMERMLGTMVYNDAFAEGPPSGEAPPPPETWGELRAALDQAHQDFGDLVRSASEDDLAQTVKFFVGPQQLGDYTRMEFCWFLLHDQIHHRGQLSVYLRLADGKVPSIYGPSADEPWM